MAAWRPDTDVLGGGVLRLASTARGAHDVPGADQAGRQQERSEGADWGSGWPRGLAEDPLAAFVTTMEASRRKGLSTSRIQTFCRAYARRLEQQRLIPAHMRRADGSPLVPPLEPQQEGELKCSWSGVGRRRVYWVDPDALEALATNELDPVTGRQLRRGHRAGWEPDQDYHPTDTLTDLRRPENAPLLAVRNLLAGRELGQLYDLFKELGLLRTVRLHAGHATDPISRQLEALAGNSLLSALEELTRARAQSRALMRELRRSERVRELREATAVGGLVGALESVRRIGEQVRAAQKRRTRATRRAAALGRRAEQQAERAATGEGTDTVALADRPAPQGDGAHAAS
jgi:hypothetical protein